MLSPPLVNATAEFKKGSPKNYIPDDKIRKISDAFNDAKDVDGFVKVITVDESAKNDFNLSPSRYISSADIQTIRTLPDLMKDLKTLTAQQKEIDEQLRPILGKLLSNV